MKNSNQYFNVQVMTADGVRLIIMLYDGVLRFNRQAQAAIAGGNVTDRTHYLNKSLAIISELQNSLNMKQGGEVAENLFRLYDFSTNQLMLANMKNDSALIESVNRVIAELKTGWEAIASDKAGASKSAQQQRRISCGV